MKQLSLFNLNTFSVRNFRHTVKAGGHSAGRYLMEKSRKAFKRFAIFAVVIGAVYFLILPGPLRITSGSTLYVPLDRPMTEWSGFDGQPTLFFMSNAPTLSANIVNQALERAVHNEKITRVILNLDGMSNTDFGPVVRVASKVKQLRQAGKEVIAYATNYNNAGYLIAMQADMVLMSNMGRFSVGSFKFSNLYLRDVFERYGVEVVTGKSGIYKSAIESYTSNEMSEPSRKVWQDTLNRQFSWTIEEIARARSLEVSFVKDKLLTWSKTIQAAGIGDADHAIAAGFVDGVISVPELMAMSYGPVSGKPDHSYVALNNFFRVEQDNRCDIALAERAVEVDGDQPVIAVLGLEGEIRPNSAMPGAIGASTLVSQLEGLARLNNLAALVIRINSPGGDAQASEFIRQELQALRAKGIPVVTSMGAVTASGGYWIASASDRIFAEPTTITGSIGAFSLRLSATTALEAVGIHTDSLASGRQIETGSIFDPVGTEEPNNLQYQTDRIYDHFLEIVSAGRGLSMESVNAVAQGRIWTSWDALDHGLVDEIGSLDMAIGHAADLARVPADCNAVSLHPSTKANMLQAFFPKGMGTFSSSYLDTLVKMSPIANIGNEAFLLDALKGDRPGVQVYCRECAMLVD